MYLKESTMVNNVFKRINNGETMYFRDFEKEIIINEKFSREVNRQENCVRD